MDQACLSDVACTDLIEMAVRPAHGGLQHKMQAIQADRQRHLDPAQNSRFDIVELDTKMGDAGAIMAPSYRPHSAAASATATVHGGGTPDELAMRANR